MVVRQRNVSGAVPLDGHLPQGVILVRQTSPVPNVSDVAQYIAQMTAELVQMATNVELELLAYFLDMARIESELAVTRSGYKPKPPAPFECP